MASMFWFPLTVRGIIFCHLFLPLSSLGITSIYSSAIQYFSYVCTYSVRPALAYTLPSSCNSPPSRISSNVTFNENIFVPSLCSWISFFWVQTWDLPSVFPLDHYIICHVVVYMLVYVLVFQLNTSFHICNNTKT